MENNTNKEIETASQGNGNFPGQVHNLPGGGIVISTFNDIVNWARSNSLWPLFIFCCKVINACNKASGRGGHPGMYTSTGII